MSARRHGRAAALVAMCALVVFVFAAPLVAGAQSTFEVVRVTVDEQAAVRAALASSPALRAFSARVEAAEADVLGAQLAFVPELSATGRYTRLSELPESARSFGGFVLPQLLDQHVGRFQASVPVTDLLYRSAQLLEAAGDRASAERARFEGERVRVAAEARTRYVELAVAEQMVTALRAIEARHEAWRDVVRERIDAGVAADADWIEVESQRLAVRRDRITAEARALEASQRLAVVMGRTDGALLQSEGLSEGLSEALRDVAPTVASGATAPPNPGVDALRRTRRALERSIEAERISALPSVSLAFGVDVAAPNPRAFAQETLQTYATWDAAIQVSFSLSGALAAIARADRMTREAAALQAEEEGLLLRIEAEQRIAATAMSAAIERRAAAADAAQLATELLDVRRTQYEHGTLTAADLALAEAAHLRALLARHDADAEASLARARVLEARSLVD